MENSRDISTIPSWGEGEYAYSGPEGGEAGEAKFVCNPEFNKKIALCRCEGFEHLACDAFVCTSNEQLSDKESVLSEICNMCGSEFVQQVKASVPCRMTDVKLLAVNHGIAAKFVRH